MGRFPDGLFSLLSMPWKTAHQEKAHQVGHSFCI